jgi:heterogeneous nuclear rnp K-like protein 2
MSEREDTVHSPSERKRSLPSDDEEDDLSSDERGGRFKRPALNTSGGEDDNSSELDYTDEPPAEERPVTPSETGDVMEVNVRSPAAAEKEKVETESTLATISLRALVTTKEAGVIIGKGGKNVSEIRDRSGAKVTISEMVQGAYERILTVTGPLDTVAKVCQNFHNRTNKKLC